MQDSVLEAQNLLDRLLYEFKRYNFPPTNSDLAKSFLPMIDESDGDNSNNP